MGGLVSSGLSLYPLMHPIHPPTTPTLVFPNHTYILTHPPSLSPTTQVDDGGKVKRLRKDCPSPTCGAGVRLAVHSDRYYCGKCYVTYKFNQEGV